MTGRVSTPNPVSRGPVEPIRSASDVEGDRVMQDPIEDRLGDDAVTEHLAPAPKALVARDHDGPAG